MKKGIQPILHTLSRYFLASVILMYAIAKIMRTQFSSPPSIWDKTIGQLSGFELTWFFYGYSVWYGMVIAFFQITAAFLLFHKRTTRLGIILYLSIMINILMIDLAYDIKSAIGMASILTIIAFYVFLSEFKSFFSFFYLKPPLFENKDRPQWLNKLSKFKYIYIAFITIALFVMIYKLKDKVMTKNEFYGAWNPINYDKWNRIYFQEASTFSIRTGNDFNIVYQGKYKFNRDTKELEFNAFDKDYLEEKINILSPDTLRMKTILKVKYKFKSENLNIFNDTIDIYLKRLY